MSAATTSATETTFVRLLGEGVDVWRPVRATSGGRDVYRLDEAIVPDEEHWEFRPGEVVKVKVEPSANGEHKIAISATGRPLRRAG